MTPEEKELEDKKEKLIDGLSPEDEELLQEAHAEHYTGTDDDMPDWFERYLENLSYQELVDIIF